MPTPARAPAGLPPLQRHRLAPPARHLPARAHAPDRLWPVSSLPTPTRPPRRPSCPTRTSSAWSSTSRPPSSRHARPHRARHSTPPVPDVARTGMARRGSGGAGSVGPHCASFRGLTARRRPQELFPDVASRKKTWVRHLFLIVSLRHTRALPPPSPTPSSALPSILSESECPSCFEARF